MNNILTVIAGLVIVFIAWKLLKGFFKFAIIAAVIALAAYYLFI